MFKTLLFVNTANGKTSAFNEQRWNGKYSIGEPHDTKLKMIARMPEKERIPRTIVFTLVDLFLKRKYNPTIMPAPNKSDKMWQKPNVPQNEALFFRTVKVAFEQRRKTLANALSAGFGELTKEQIQGIIAECGHPADIRGERLDVSQFVALSDAIGQALQ